MKTIGSMLVALAALASAAELTRADDKKIDKAKLVGKWQIVQDTGAAKATATWELTKEGKFVTVLHVDGLPDDPRFGTYKVEGDKNDKLTITTKGFGGTATSKYTIKSLADGKLNLEDKDKQTTELKKVNR